MNSYEPIIGLEIHVELATHSKMFCGCKADYFGAKPNTHTCPVCLGLPGALPVPNRKAIEWCIAIGLALNCEIPNESKFDRKNYFYPDLPKGYQISQYDEPFARHGELKIKTPSHVILGSEATPESVLKTDSGRAHSSLAGMTNEKIIRIRRVHMEEDTGKLLHTTLGGKPCTLIDFNRSSVPLVEIVTEPDFRSSEDARIFLKKLHQIIRYLGVSDADMEKGSMRLEPNISLREVKSEKLKVKSIHSFIEESDLPKYKVEVKNINSFNFAKKAIDYEIERHTKLLESGETPRQETRGWDEKKNCTYSQRSKEEAHDYRYFPEPDIPPIIISEEEKKRIRETLPELPDDRIKRFMQKYSLSEYDACILVDDKSTSEYFEEAVSQGSAVRDQQSGIKPKIIANWIINKKADISKVAPDILIKLILSKEQKPQMEDGELNVILHNVINSNPKAVADYKGGKEGSIMFLVGQAMKEMRGKADAIVVKNLLRNLLK